MRSLPIFVMVADRPVVVVGAGAAAAVKIRVLLQAAASVTVVAPRTGREVAEMVAAGHITVRSRGFVVGDVAGAALVCSASGLLEVDARVAEAARAAGIPVNVVDRPELSDFLTPAIVDRDPVVIGISTGAPRRFWHSGCAP